MTNYDRHSTGEAGAGDEGADRDVIDLVRSAAARHAAPSALRERVVVALRAQGAPALHRAARVEGADTTAQARKSARWPQWMTLSAGLACGALATWLALMLPLGEERAAQIETEVIAAHSRSLQAAHATDVASSDQHTVKPWLSSRLDFSPTVVDLGAEGYPLVGGRLDYIMQRPVAALLYHRQQHVINVFVWPVTAATGSTERNTTRRGLHSLAWVQDGMQYWAVTDLGSAELKVFVENLRKRMPGA